MTFYNKLNTIFQEYYDALPSDQNTLEIQNTDGQIVKIYGEQVLENWFLAGDFGCGKTLTAIQMVRLWQRHIAKMSDGKYDNEFIDHNPKFITLQDYIELNNRSIQFRDLVQTIESYRNSWILILDDISLTNWSESSINHLTQLIKHRHENRLQTIFTSNKGLKALKEEIPAVISRVIQMCGTDNCVLFKSIDHRITGKGQATKFQLENK